MSNKRKQYGSDFKAKIAIAGIRGDKTVVTEIIQSIQANFSRNVQLSPLMPCLPWE